MNLIAIRDARSSLWQEAEFRHLGGGRKGILLLLRYVYILAAAYLLIFSRTSEALPVHGLMIALALTSNVVLSILPPRVIFSWFVEAPVLIGDTLWVAWALHSTGANGEELFLLYLFVLFLAVIGENIILVVLGSTLISALSMYFSHDAGLTTDYMLRVTFFYTVALFFGYVISEIRHERLRADKGLAWARELELKVAERTAELSRLYEQAQVASRLKSEFLATISHELRTPLHIIVGYGGLLIDPETVLSAQERRWMLQRLMQAAQDQIHTVDNLLDIGRVEAGRMPVNVHPVRLDRFLLDLKSRPWMPPAEGVSLRWELAQSPTVFETDPEKLIVVLSNLINNAIKFTLIGSITVRAREDHQERCLVFDVEDTGPGIDPLELPNIFEMFRQGHVAVTPRQGGVGLGLAIVDRYVRLLGGTICVQSNVGLGSRFQLKLPLTLPARATAVVERMSA